MSRRRIRMTLLRVVVGVLPVALLLPAATVSSATPRSAPPRSAPPRSASPGNPVAFSDATGTQGLVQPLLGMHAHAAAFGDVNGDGWQDLFVGTFADYPNADYQVRGATSRAPDRLLLGGPAGFTPDTSFPHTCGRGAAAVFVDLENTGYPDLVLVRYTYDDNPLGRAPTVVLHNDHGHFSAPQTLPVPQGRAAGILDYDGDGLPDILVTHDDYFGDTGTSVLLHNKGNLQFEDVTATAGLSGIVAFGVSTTDLNGDGWPDVVVTDTKPVFQQTATSPAARVFVNNRNGTFREAPNSAFPWTTYDYADFSTGVTAADLNRDGRPDLVIGHHFESTIEHGTTAPIHAYLNTGTDSQGNPMFQDITQSSGLPALATLAADVQIADFDNDGWPDIITTASSAGGTRPTVFRNLGLSGGVPRFATPDGLGDQQYWLNAAVADVDHDGRLDVFVSEWEPIRPSLLFHNETLNSGHWLDVSAAAGRPGQGLGTRVDVYAAGHVGSPAALLGSQEVTVSSGLGTGRSPLLHFGVGDVTSVDVRVTGPGGGTTVDLSGVGADQGISVPPVVSTATTRARPSRSRCGPNLWRCRFP